MLIQDFEPVARHDRLVGAWQHVIFVLVLLGIVGAIVASVLATLALGVPVDALPPYTVTALAIGVA